MKDFDPIKPLGVFIAIDPDSKGGMALSIPHGGIQVKGLEGLFAKEILGDMKDWCERFGVTCIIIERQWPRVTDAKGSIFKSGIQYGVVVCCAALMRIPIYFVNPMTWTKNLPKEKGERVALVNSKPSFVGAKLLQKDHGLADAFLFAEWIRSNVTDKGTGTLPDGGSEPV